jgi:hypothetical protein
MTSESKRSRDRFGSFSTHLARIAGWLMSAFGALDAKAVRGNWYERHTP